VAGAVAVTEVDGAVSKVVVALACVGAFVASTAVVAGVEMDVAVTTGLAVIVMGDGAATTAGEGVATGAADGGGVTTTAVAVSAGLTVPS
jgi:hypothetical protein